MNPCKCGYFGDTIKECVCSAKQISDYKKRISGPIMDRFDLQVWVDKVDLSDLEKASKDELSSSIKKRVTQARQIQSLRYKNLNYKLNSQIPSQDIDKFINISNQARNLLKQANQKFNFSARSYFKLLKVARTIADLENQQEVKEEFILEAINYRFNN